MTQNNTKDGRDGADCGGSPSKGQTPGFPKGVIPASPQKSTPPTNETKSGADLGDATDRDMSGRTSGDRRIGSNDPSRDHSKDSSNDRSATDPKSGSRSDDASDLPMDRDMADRSAGRNQGGSPFSRSGQGGQPIVTDIDSTSREAGGFSDTQRDDSSAEGANTESDRLSRGQDRDENNRSNPNAPKSGSDRTIDPNRQSNDKSGKPNRS